MSQPTSTNALAGVRLHHVEYFVADAVAHAEELTGQYGFHVSARHDAADHHSIVLRQGSMVLVVTEGRDDHPAANFVRQHGDGVADIAMSAPDAAAAFEEAVGRGAVAVTRPAAVVVPDKAFSASVAGFGDVTHTFVQAAVPTPDPVTGAPLVHTLDHFAVVVGHDELESTAAFYEQVLGFSLLFKESTIIGDQAMNSKVMQNAEADVTLVLVAPEAGREAGFLDDFLKQNPGSGVQHIAFATDDIVSTTTTMRDAGVGFLVTPDTYYEMLVERLDVEAHDVTDLQDLGILVDSDHDGQLFQIFTRSTHSRNTFFYEVIERLGARTFGNGNIVALYEAVVRDRAKGGVAG